MRPFSMQSRAQSASPAIPPSALTAAPFSSSLQMGPIRSATCSDVARLCTVRASPPVSEVAVDDLPTSVHHLVPDLARRALWPDDADHEALLAPRPGRLLAPDVVLRTVLVPHALVRLPAHGR